MLKFIATLIIQFFLLDILIAQNLIEADLKIDDYKNWESIEYNPILSSNGKNVAYQVIGANHPTYLVIQTTDNAWCDTVVSMDKGRFISNGDRFLFKNDGDSLHLFNTKTRHYAYIDRIKSYLTPEYEDCSWIAYTKFENVGELHLVNVKTSIERVYNNVSGYKFNSNGSVLLLNVRDTIIWLNLMNMAERIIHKGRNCSKFTFNSDGSKLVFMSRKEGENCVYYFDTKSDSAIQKFTAQNLGLKNDFAFQNFSFGKDNSYITFSVTQAAADSKRGVTENLKIFASVLGKPRKTTNEGNGVLTYVLNIQYNSLFRLADQFEKVVSQQTLGSCKYILTERSEYCTTSPLYDTGTRRSLYLVSIRDGKRILISSSVKRSNTIQLSPTGKYVIYFDAVLKRYNIYDVEKQEWRVIAQPKNCSWYRARVFSPANQLDYGIAAWLPNDKGILLNDEYDIWLVDLISTLPARNITHYLGRKTQLSLRLLQKNNSVVNTKEYLLLIVFDKNDKRNGFYKVNIAKNEPPILLTMESKVYYIDPSQHNSFNDLGKNGIKPIKAKSSNSFIVVCMSPTESPNFYFTTDFRQFRKLSNVSPESKYNWLTAEQVKWTRADTDVGIGIMYKPENFDRNKKYPVIFYSYEHASDYLNEYVGYDLEGGKLPIPYFVSNGYIVVVPDIDYIFGEPGESILSSLLPAISFIKTLTYVDSTRIAIQGHSYGGYAVNYLVTQTRFFKAAASSAGFSNLTSSYGTAFADGDNANAYFEQGQGRIGTNLWRDQNRYLKNSPLFFANEIQTPLLIEVGTEDMQVPCSQGMELFSALRRLGKPAWLLQYKGEGHVLYESAAVDYTTRLRDFFDYFLKDGNFPYWMN